jgi:hypothetical protein
LLGYNIYGFWLELSRGARSAPKIRSPERDPVFQKSDHRARVAVRYGCREAVYHLVLRRVEAYRKARRKEKGLILDQLEKDTGYDRKTLIRLLKRASLYPERMRESIRPRKEGLMGTREEGQGNTIIRG